MSIKLPHIILLAKRLLLAYGLFAICRVLFFIFNYSAFAQAGVVKIITAFASGFWFDTSAITYLFGLVILLHLIPLNLRNHKYYQLGIKILFTISAFITTLLNLIDVGYFAISGKRSGVELIGMQSSQNASPWVYVIDYWYLVLILLVLMRLVWMFYPKIKNASYTKLGKQLVIEIGVMLLLGVTTFFGARGSFGLKPLNTLDAAKIAGAEVASLTLNTPFQMMHTLSQTGVDAKNYFTNANLIQQFNPIKQIQPSGKTKGKNVVLVIVESLGKEYVGFYNQGKGYTPFLDSLMQHSLVYQHAYANGKRSIEGIPAIVAGMPSWLTGDYINSYYQTNVLHSTGYYLQQQDYEVAFYHGGKNGTMSFDRFVAQTQAGNYLGLNQYPRKKEDFDGNWGIPDMPYLSYVSNEISASQNPFFTTVFTLSSHHPYQLPAEAKNKYTGGPLPIHATIQYADDALRSFFAFAAKQAWFNNTVFVITADHSSENTLPYYQTMQGKYEIPLVVFEPKPTIYKEAELNTTTIDHISIMPLLVSMVTKQTTPIFSLSSDVAIQFDGGLYQIIKYPHVVHFDGEEVVASYNLLTDSLMQTNLQTSAQSATHQPIVDSLLIRAKAVIQTYNNSLIHNKTHE